MGFAFFNLRKLMLNSEINNLQVRISALTTKEQELSNIASEVGQWSTVSTALATGTSASEFASSDSSIFSDTSFITTLSNAYTAIEQKEDTGSSSIWQQMQNEIIQTSSQLINSGWADVSPAQLAAMETQVQNERMSLETQLQVKSKEAESVDQALEAAIKDSAPKLGSA